MNYIEAINFLRELNKFGVNLGLSRMERLLGCLGHPERELKCIHVAGTNGKGSTCAMLASVLQAAGYKVGLFTSPHLHRYTERIRINGQEIAPAAVAEGISRLRPLVEEAGTVGCPPTEFEVTTALAMWHFAVQKVDWAVVEVGLGGEMDSTNVITPRVAVVTNVAIDHTEVLGSDLASIASTKAGIIKTGVPVVTAAEGTAARVIQQRAAQLGAPLIWVTSADKPQSPGQPRVSWELEPPYPSGWNQTAIKVYGRLGHYPGIALPLAGKHQAANAAVALAAVEVLIEEGEPISREAIYRGIASTVWPGRLEMLQEDPPVLVDGAHNPAAASRLVEALADHFPKHDWHFVLGVLQDKDRSGIVEEIASRANTVIVTPPPNPRAGDMQQLVELCSRYCTRTIWVPQYQSALQQGVELLAAQGGTGRPLLCVTGSLFLVGPARQLLPGLLKKYQLTKKCDIITQWCMPDKPNK